MFQRERSLFVALGLAASLAYAHHAYTSYRTNVSGDFYQFWVVGQALTSFDVSNPYSRVERERIGREFWQRARSERGSEYEKSARYRRDRLEPAATPFLYAVFRGFSTGDYETDYEAFRVLSFVSYAVGLVGLAWAAGIPLPLGALLLLVASEWFWPFRIDTAHSNVNQLQLGLLAGALCLRRLTASRLAQLGAGALLGFLLFFKPNLLYSVALLFVFWTALGPSGTWRLIVLGFGLAAMAAVLASWLLFGSFGCWSDWLAGSSEILQSPDYLRRSLPRLLGFAPPVWAFWLAAAALSVPVLVSVLRRAPLPGVEGGVVVWRDLVLAGTGGVLLVLTSPVVHVHYFVLTLPLVVALLAPSVRDGEASIRGLSARHAIVVVALLLIGGLFGAHFTLWPFLGAAILYLLTLAHLHLPAFGAPVADRMGHV